MASFKQVVAEALIGGATVFYCTSLATLDRAAREPCNQPPSVVGVAGNGIAIGLGQGMVKKLFPIIPINPEATASRPVCRSSTTENTGPAF